MTNAEDGNVVAEAAGETAIQQKLARIFNGFHKSVERLEYELVVLAVPRFPGNIEAVSNRLHQEILGELLEVFLAQLKGSENGNSPQPNDGSRNADADSAPPPADGGTYRR